MDEKDIKKQNKNFNPLSDGNNGKPKFNMYWIYGLMALVFISINFLNFGNHVQDISWQFFERNILHDHDVEKIIVVNHEYAEIFVKTDRFN